MYTDVKGNYIGCWHLKGRKGRPIIPQPVVPPDMAERFQVGLDLLPIIYWPNQPAVNLKAGPVAPWQARHLLHSFLLFRTSPFTRTNYFVILL